MRLELFIGIVIFFISLAAHCSDLKTINDTVLNSFKDNGIRSYSATKKMLFNSSIEDLRQRVEEFDERCNQDYRDKRVELDKNHKCKYFNRNVVETIVIQNDHILNKKEKNLNSRYILKRLVYNKGLYHYYDLVSVYKDSDAVYRITQKMLTDEEAQNYLGKVTKNNYVFDTVDAVFTLEKKGKTETELTYNYSCTTDHWLLNKEISVGKVYESLAMNLDELFKSLQ